jgi:hypothetical protein
MSKKIILIPPNYAFGDCLSIIGLTYYLLEHYDVVYLYLNDNSFGLVDYYESYFENEPLLNNRIKLTTLVPELISQGSFGEYHICNTLTGSWAGPNWLFSDLDKVDTEFYFNDLNPIYRKIDILPEFVCSPNKHLPSKSLEINHIFYYELIGLNNTVRMDYFNYVRNLEKEALTKQEILAKYNLKEGDKYNIVNDPVGELWSIMPYIKNNYPTINLNYLAPSLGSLLSLVEGAETIHFIEGCNVNFFYHCQHKDIFNYNGKIYFHIWARNRCWPEPHMNLDYAWKMMAYPRLSNWEFIFDENQIGNEINIT